MITVMKNKSNVVVVVGDAGYEGQQLIGVFSSVPKAKQGIKDMALDDKRMFDQYAIAKLDLNQGYKGWSWIFNKDENGKYIAKFYESSRYGDLIEC